VDQVNSLDALSALGAMTLAISRATTAEAIYQEALAAIARLTGLERAAVLLFDPDGVMRFKAWLGLSDGYRAAVEGHTPWRPGQREVAPVLIVDVATDPGLAPFLPVIEAEGIGAMAMVPLVTGGGTIGKFMVYHPARHRFGAQELHLMDIVAAHTAFAIDRQRAAEAQQRAESRLEDAEAQLWEKQRQESLVTMAGGLAHDFNNLLTGILGNVSAALEELPAGAAAREALLDAVAGAQGAAELTQQLLAYTGRAAFVIGRADLGDLVQESARLLATAISRKATLSLECAEALPAVEGDVTQLRQVVMNLLVNASDALANHTGTIHLTVSAVTPDAELLRRAVPGHSLQPRPCVSLVVTDSGTGMDEATRRRIFDPFFTTKFHGRGLGLASALGIIRSHRGAIVVDSVPGRGTSIQVLLPQAASPAPALRGDEEGAGEEGAGRTVLLVDDEELIRQSSGRILRRAGYRVLKAEHGLQALELMEREGQAVDLVILDLTMPRMSGEETLEALRHRWPGLPVLLSSGFTARDLPPGAQGGAEFLHKPYTSSELRRVVERALRGRAEHPLQ
jgi:signal transduction histidine kinase/ActR/RegA family two-component response regulator